MKKIFVAVFCLITVAAQAQQFRFGAQVSPQISFWKVEGDLYVDNGKHFGYQLGLMLDQTLGSSERFAITSGLNLNVAPGGFISNPEGLNPGNKVWNWSVKNLDIPITLRLRSDAINKTVLYAQYGFNLGFTLGAVAKNDDDKEAGQGFDYEKTTPSLTMGVGIENKINDKMDLLIGVYFINGIKNVIIDDANDDNMFPEQVGLHAGILF